MKNEKIIDVVGIKNTIKIKHKSFMDTVGYMPVKISSDKQLALTRLAARLSQIFQCFKSEGVIDSYDECISPDAVNSYKGFHILKKGFEQSIFVWTDGNDIIARDSSFLIHSGFLTPYYMIERDIDLENYDWIVFSSKLLDYIHTVIYQRQLSLEKSIWKNN